MKLFYDIRHRKEKWHRIYHRPLVGKSVTHYEFDHVNAVFTYVDRVGNSRDRYAYSEVKIVETLQRLKYFIPWVKSDHCHFEVIVRGRPQSLFMHFPLKKQEYIRSFIEHFNARKDTYIRQSEQQEMLAEKASGKHDFSLPEGAASNAGSPVAIPLAFAKNRK